MLLGDLDGKANPKRADICMADSLCCTKETNTVATSTVEQLNFNKK